MVGETGFEPATLWSQTRCATRLRYSPTLLALIPVKTPRATIDCVFKVIMVARYDKTERI